jgi:thiamine kinase-like enzyme
MSSALHLSPPRTGFWPTAKKPIDRILFLFPSLNRDSLAITTTELSSNASFVNYVRLIKVADSTSALELFVIEKSIRKIAGISSLEARYHRQAEFTPSSSIFQHPSLYGMIDTPLDTLIFTEYIVGRPPKLHSIASRIAGGIVEIETSSMEHICQTSNSRSLEFWQMDFFRPWYVLRPKFNHSRLLRKIPNLSKMLSGLQSSNESLSRLQSKISLVKTSAQLSPRCFSHLDFLRKNFIVSQDKLYLIDWSEFKVGRLGFDGGSYLSSIFRRSPMKVYVETETTYMETYKKLLQMPEHLDQSLLNTKYIFLTTSLWHLLRDQTFEQYRQEDRLDELSEKINYLVEIL